jgi:hypothetical protein
VLRRQSIRDEDSAELLCVTANGCQSAQSTRPRFPYQQPLRASLIKVCGAGPTPPGAMPTDFLSQFLFRDAPSNSAPGRKLLVRYLKIYPSIAGGQHAIFLASRQARWERKSRFS